MSDPVQNNNDATIVYEHKTLGGETLEHLAQYYYGDKNAHTQIKEYQNNSTVLDGVETDTPLKPARKVFIPNVQEKTVQDSTLLFDVDYKCIWDNRINSFIRAVNGLQELVQKAHDAQQIEGAKWEKSFAGSQDSKDLNFQVQQLAVLDYFVTRLGDYARKYIRGFVSSLLPPFWKPSYHHNMPPTYFIRSLFKQASTDLEIIQTALIQRKLIRRKNVKEGEPLLAVSDTGRMLVLADRLANLSLNPAVFMRTQGQNGRNLIVTFFSETTFIRQIPYDSDVILLGLPLASVAANDMLIAMNEDKWVPLDILAIPHEIGHHIYLRRGKMMMRAKDNGLPDSSNVGTILNGPYKEWFEEIFADIYSCFIAGPIAVLGMQAILADAYPGEWVYDDGHHPVPVLRPFIMTDILRKLSENIAYKHQFKNAADLFDQNWEAILRLQGIIPAEQSSLADVTIKYQIDGHNDQFETPPFLFDLDLRLPTHVHEDTTDHKPTLKSVKLHKLRDDLAPMIDFYIEVLVKACNMEDFEPWSLDIDKNTGSLQDYAQVLRDLVTNTRQLNNSNYPDPIASELEPFGPKRSDFAVNEIRIALAEWDHEGPEGDIVGG